MAVPSSRRPSKWRARASAIRSKVSAAVFPVAMHPGTSGAYADQLLPAFSTTTAYFMGGRPVLESRRPAVFEGLDAQPPARRPFGRRLRFGRALPQARPESAEPGKPAFARGF